MNRIIKDLIHDYIQKVEARFEQFSRETNTPSPKTNLDWALKGPKKKGTLSDGTTYSKHGYGCLFEGEKDSVDFDFGEHGEIDGFDTWRLINYFESLDSEGLQLKESEIKEWINTEEKEGRIEKRGNLYYLKNKPNKTVQTTSASARV